MTTGKRFLTFGPDAEVFGGAMMAFVESINFEDFKNVMYSHGLAEIDPERWYPQQMWLDVFNEIASDMNATANLVSIGMKIVNTAIPAEYQPPSFVDLLEDFGDLSYNGNNRGKDIGYIKTEVVSDGHVIMHDGTPYPDDFVYGAYYGLARRFLPQGTHFLVKFDPKAPRREDGGQETLVHIYWE